VTHFDLKLHQMDVPSFLMVTLKKKFIWCNQTVLKLKVY